MGLKVCLKAALFVILILPAAPGVLNIPAGGVPSVGDTPRGVTVWSGNITVQEDITVPAGETLLIMPGATVTFARGVRVDVYGTLLVNGSREKPVRLESPEVWAGIILHSATAYISHVVMKGASYCVSSDSSHVVVKNSTFLDYAYIFSSTGGSTVVWVNSTFSQDDVVVDAFSEVEVRYFFQIRTVDILYGPLSSTEVTLSPAGGGEVMRLSTDENGTTPLVEVVALLYTGGILPQTIGYSVEVKVLDRSWWSHFYTPSEEGNLFREVISHIPPTLLNFSTNLVVEEDVPTVIPLYFYTPGDFSPRFQVNTTSPFITYIPDPPSLFVLAPNPACLDGEVEVRVWDGLSWGNYTLQVSVRERNDPPTVLLPFKSVTLKPGEESLIPVSIHDEETPVEDLMVTTSHPWAICDLRNSTLHLRVPEDLSSALLYLNVSDYFKVSSAALLIKTPPVQGTPEPTGVLPEISLEEEGTFQLNLSNYFRDILWFEVVGTRGDLVTCYIEGSNLLVEGIRDRWGEGEIYIKVTGEDGGSEVFTFNVTVRPAGDPPELLDPLCYPTRPSLGLYRFEVTYRDSDGDRPRLISLVLDDVEHPLEVPRIPLDFSGGVRFTIYLQIPEGNHSFYFRAIDRWGEETATDTVEGLLVDEHLTGRFWQEGSLQMYWLGRGSGEVRLRFDDTPPPLDRIGTRVYLNISIAVEVEGAPEIERMEAVIDLSQIAPGDVIISTARAYQFIGDVPVEVQSSYSSLEGVIRIRMNDPVPDRLHIYALPSVERDSDGDGVPDLCDLFPADPKEWRDSDSDGVGDSEDPDDDNDGYPDEVEMLSGSDPLSASSVPSDMDGDGTPDFIDEDTDGDGMPDAWEEMRGLDPYNPSDSEEDPDGDGVTNLQEYRRGEEAWSGKGGGGGYGWVSYVLYALAALLGGLIIYTLWREGCIP